MPSTVIIEKSILIDAPIDAVWRTSAEDFERIALWDGNVKRSQATGSGEGSAPVGGRICEMYNRGRTVEQLVGYDPARREFAYDIVEGLPGFVVSARNTWTHDAVAPGQTQLTMRVTMAVRGVLGAVMRGPMKAQMGKVLGKAQEELKHFIETGEPHPRKRKKLKRG